MSKEIIKESVKKELAILSGARCAKCNIYLKEDFLTKKQVEFKEYAHIIARSEDGPRGIPGTLDKNNVHNLIILCPICHKIIDDNPVEYDIDFLLDLKKKHEERIFYLTSLDCKKRVLPVVFHSVIGMKSVFFQKNDINESILKEGFYPSNDPYIDLSYTSSLNDNDSRYYEEAIRELNEMFHRYEKVLMQNKIALFALAPQPLLIYLGTKLQKLSQVTVKQRSRETESWDWIDEDGKIELILNKPETINKENDVSFLIAISDKVTDSRIKDVLPNSDLWVLSVENPNMNIVKNKNMIDQFSKIIMKSFSELKESYGMEKPIHVFPVMPNSFAIEFGRARMPKVYNSIVIYDQVKIDKKTLFIKAIQIE